MYIPEVVPSNNQTPCINVAKTEKFIIQTEYTEALS